MFRKAAVRYLVLSVIALSLLYLVLFPLKQNLDRRIAPTFGHQAHSQISTSNTEMQVNKNTSRQSPLFVLYNRIPKCGSTTLLKLIRRLAVKNNFDFIASKVYNKENLSDEELVEFKDWIRERISSGNSTFFNRHLFYIDMPEINDNVVYINLMRDPVQRFVSGFYYLRKYELEIKEKRRRGERKGWQEWLDKSLVDCVQNVSDPECSDFSDQRLSNWGGTFSRRFPTGLGYLCGDDNFCQDANSQEAGDRAIDNIENKFGVVGVAEDYEMTLAVLEHRLPRFFKGALEEFGVMKSEGRGVENKVNHEEPEQRTVEMLAERMREEVRVYKHVKDKLGKLCDGIPACQNRASSLVNVNPIQGGWGEISPPDS